MENQNPMRVLEEPAPEVAARPAGGHAAAGWRGRIRVGRILWAAFKIRTALWLHRKGWFTGGADESALRRAEGARLREELIALGPTFIKIGQTLATRIDLVPVEYTEELALLQDRVPPFPNAQAWATIERELGHPAGELFASIDPDPIASASLGQVYQGRLANGQEVAIKVQRPDLERRIALDLAALRYLAPRLERSGALKAVIDWSGVIDEFARVIADETDYVKEAANADAFRQNFAKWPEIYVPRIYPELSSRRVITMDFVPGIKVDDHDGLRRMGLTPISVAELLTRTYLKQLLEDGFFHADPHPGNLRVMPDGRLAFFDFGMVGRISLELQSQLVDAFFHIVERDWRALLGDGVRLGFLRIDPHNEAELQHIGTELIDHYEALRLGSLGFKELTYDVADVLYRYPFQVPANFTFILRAITTLEGVGTKADPNFNFFLVARPYAKEFMLRREGRYLGGKLISRVLRSDEGNFDWNKAWKLAKMAWKYYVTDR
jgi:predicted unusual protein kinase regulating ubiquinone biosynthesis (AarF/ABC1/UbiB family)